MVLLVLKFEKYSLKIISGVRYAQQIKNKLKKFEKCIYYQYKSSDNVKKNMEEKLIKLQSKKNSIRKDELFSGRIFK